MRREGGRVITGSRRLKCIHRHPRATTAHAGGKIQEFPVANERPLAGERIMPCSASSRRPSLGPCLLARAATRPRGDAMQPPAGAYGHPPPPHGQPMMPNGAPAPHLIFGSRPRRGLVDGRCWFSRRGRAPSEDRDAFAPRARPGPVFRRDRDPPRTLPDARPPPSRPPSNPAGPPPHAGAPGPAAQTCRASMMPGAARLPRCIRRRDLP